MAKASTAKKTVAAKAPKTAPAADQTKPAVQAAPVAAEQAKPAEGAQGTQEFQAASGADGNAGGAAAPTAATEAKASEATDGAGAADPAGTTDASAASAEETRGQAEAAAADQKAAAKEEKQPEETAQPPVAEPYNGPVLVVTGPPKGFRRAGFAFGAEPRELTPADFEVEPGFAISDDAALRFLAIVTEPALKCIMRQPDGEEHEFPAEAIAAVQARVDRIRAEGGEGPIGELLGQLLDSAADD